ncbi:MAG TPA: lactate utilization protein, partial [Candidatus Paceibacterota bacterium]
MDFNALATDTTLEKLIAALKERNIEGRIVPSKEAALETIKELIPKGASIMNGSSRTLDEVGFIEYLKAGQHGWNNLHEGILAEKDPQKQAELRRQAILSDYYLGSVHAMTEAGELLIASNTGSQLPHIVYSSPNVIFVVSTKKIVPTLEDAKQRLVEHVMPLEDIRMKEVYGPEAGTKLNKEVIFHGEAVFTGRKITVLLVEENLGF